MNINVYNISLAYELLSISKTS